MSGLRKEWDEAKKIAEKSVGDVRWFKDEAEKLRGEIKEAKTKIGYLQN